MNTDSLQKVPPLHLLCELARVEGFQAVVPSKNVQNPGSQSQLPPVPASFRDFSLLWCSPEGRPRIAFQYYSLGFGSPSLSKDVICVMIAPIDKEEEAFQNCSDADRWFFLPEEYLEAFYQQSPGKKALFAIDSLRFLSLPLLPLARRERGEVVDNHFFSSSTGDLSLITLKAPPLARRAYPGRFFTLSVSSKAFYPGYEVIDDYRNLTWHSFGFFSEDAHISRVPLNPLKAFKSLSPPFGVSQKTGVDPSAKPKRSSPFPVPLPLFLSALVRPALPEYLTFGIKVVGARTHFLARRPKGALVDLLGPLGSPAPFYREAQHVLLVGGGIGIPPLYPVAEVYIRAGRRVTLLAGGRTRDQLCPGRRFLYPEFEQMGVQVILCIEEEENRFVTDLMLQYLTSQEGEGVDIIYSCGPPLMLAQVARIAEQFHCPCYVFLENRMECGTGVCMSCVVPLRKEGGWYYSPVCRGGPVFDTRVIDWEAFLSQG